MRRNLSLNADVPLGPSSLPRCENLALIDTVEVTIETLYQHRRHRFLACRVAATAPRRFGVGYHGEWHLHSFLGERHCLRSCRYACCHALA